MRAWICIVFLIVAVYLLAGSSDHGIIPDKRIEASINELKKEAKDVFITTKEFALETTEKLRGSIESELDEVKSEMKDLRRKARKVSGEEKKAIQSRLAKLEKKERSLEEKLRKLGYADGSFWGKIKNGYRKAVDSLQGAWSSFLAWFGGYGESLIASS